MSWILPVAAAWVVLAGPGYLILRTLDVRSPIMLGAAPPVTVAVTVVLTGLFRLVGLPWTPVTALLALILVAAVASLAVRHPVARSIAGRRVATKSRSERWGAPWNASRAVIVTGIAVFCGLSMAMSASTRMGGIGTLQGGYDAFFHHASIAFIREDGDAFLTTALSDIYGEPTFYPVVFSALASLLPFDVVTSANGMVLAMLAALPAAVAAMLSALLGSRPGAPIAVAAGAAGTALFLSTAGMALVMGLWPTVLGVTCLPVAIASVFRIVDDLRGPLSGKEALIHAVVIAGAVLAHPAMFFSLAVVGGLLLLVRGFLRIILRDSPCRGALQMFGALSAAVAAVVVSATVLSDMHLTAPSRDSLSSVLRQILVDSPRIPVISPDVWPVAIVWVLALTGGVAAVRRWESVGITAVIGLAVVIGLQLATQFEHPLAAALVNPWYAARERIAPLMMCLLVLLMARGVIAAVNVSKRGRLYASVAPLAVGAVAVTVLVAILVPHRLPLMGSLAYTAYGVHLAPYAPPEERSFIERTAADLPPDAVVLADPRDGAPLYWFIGGVETVYPTLSNPQTRDQALIASYVTDPDDRRLVCGALDRVGPTHLYRDNSEFSGRSLNGEASAPWAGIHDIPDSRLTLVDSEGPYALYELETPC